MNSGSGNTLSAGQREEIMRQAQAEVALATMQTLMTQITEKCFKKCISSPGTSMSSSEQVGILFNLWHVVDWQKLDLTVIRFYL